MDCTSGGVWNNKPTCDINQCTGSLTISNSASVNPTTTQNHGYSFTVTCAAGHTASAASGTMDCSSGGTWTNKPTCDINQCSSGQSITNSATIDPTTTKNHGYSFSVTCAAGYSASVPSGTMNCNSGGTWTNKPTCDINQCSSGQSITNSASIDPTTAQNHGYSFSVTCAAGHTASASSGTMDCSSAGVWNNKPTCDANTCDPGQAIANSASVDPNPTSQNTG